MNPKRLQSRTLELMRRSPDPDVQAAAAAILRIEGCTAEQFREVVQRHGKIKPWPTGPKTITPETLTESLWPQAAQRG